MPDEIDDNVLELDITENEERFRHNVEAYVIGRTVTGLVVRPDFVEVHLDSGDRIKFKVRGADLAIYLPSGPSDPPASGWDVEPSGTVN